MIAAIKRAFFGPELRTYDVSREDLGGVPWRAAMPTATWFVESDVPPADCAAAWQDYIDLPEVQPVWGAPSLPAPVPAAVPAPVSAAPSLPRLPRLPPLPSVPGSREVLDSAELLNSREIMLVTEDELPALAEVPGVWTVHAELSTPVPDLSPGGKRTWLWLSSGAAALVLVIAVISAASGGQPRAARATPDTAPGAAPVAVAPSPAVPLPTVSPTTPSAPAPQRIARNAAHKPSAAKRGRGWKHQIQLAMRGGGISPALAHQLERATAWRSTRSASR